jgi:mannose/cellobiose epimerase-like protein (N-acyl-D-glucosamine 2-epimerase family)
MFINTITAGSMDTMEDSIRLRDVPASLRHWATDVALPLWATSGFDDIRGGFHERLHLNGTADIEAARRTRVQARQIYVFSHAAVLGWYPDGARVANRAFEFMLDKCHSPDGKPGFVHLLEPTNAIANPLRDLYDHAFILLALGWLARATNDAQVTALIDEILAFLDEHLAAGDGTFYEGVPRTVPRRQNPHMHLLEAMLGLHQTINHPEALTRAAALRNLLVGKFLDPDTHTLREYFTEGWEPCSGQDGDLREPGHHAEWVWLIRTHERLTGQASDPLAGALLDWATTSAQPSTGFLIDEAEPTAQVRHGTRRLWPQTELAKACLVESEVGRAGAADDARRTLANIVTHYLAGPKPGLWFDQFDPTGRPISQYVPASSLYHIFCAIAEADRVLGTN